MSQPTTYEVVCQPAQRYRPQFVTRSLLFSLSPGRHSLSSTVEVRRTERMFVYFPPSTISARPGLTAAIRSPDWKQTERGATSVTGSDRCSAWCRVSPSLGCPSVADRYHNHTSPLLSPAYWIKHPPSCPSRPSCAQTLEGNLGFLRSWEVTGRTWKGRSDGDGPEVLCSRRFNSLVSLSDVKEGWMFCFLEILEQERTNGPGNSGVCWKLNKRVAASTCMWLLTIKPCLRC